MLHSSENIGSPIDSVERGRKGDDLALPIVAGNGSHHLAQLLGIYPKPRQRRNAKQADIIAGGQDRVQASKQGARLRSIGDVHALNDEGDSCLGQLMDDVVALVVRAVEDAEVGPLALGSSLG